MLQLVPLFWALVSSFAKLQFVCQNWGVSLLNCLCTGCYGYDDWSSKYLLSFELCDLIMGVWHDFCILSWLLRLKRIRNRTKYMLILQNRVPALASHPCLYSPSSEVVQTCLDPKFYKLSIQPTA